MQNHHPDWSSHIPTLIRAIESTTGPVLELGTGISSTPLLHMLCFDQDRKLVSYDSDEKYINLFRKFRTKEHEVIHVINWDEIEAKIMSMHWGVVFVDHKPAEQRIVEIKKLANNADLIVIHDSQDPAYHYEEIYPLFKYRFDYTKSVTRTTVLSNVKEFIWQK